LSEVADRREHRTHVWASVCVVCLLLLTTARVAAAREPQGYVVERWTVEEGLLNNAITSIIQTRDGYLWIGTWAGMARFDGVRFTPVADTLPNDHGRALVEDQDGAIWIGLSGMGVARWQNGRADLFTPNEGLAGADVRALALDEGRIWVATENGLSVVHDGRVTTWRTRDGLPSNVVNDLSRRPGGGLWVATAGGLCQVTRLQVQCAASARGITPYAVLETRDGRLLVGTNRGLLSGDATLGAALACRGDCFARESVSALLQARDDGLWIGFADGEMTHRHTGVDRRYGVADGLPPGGLVDALAEDEEGSVWAAITNGGLARLSRKRVETITTADGLPGKVIGSIVQDAAGTIWAGTECSPVSELRNGRFVPRFVEHTKDGCAQVLWAARDGSLWIGTSNRGLFRWRDGRMEHFGLETGLSDVYIRGLFEDRDGVIWIGTAVGGLHYYANGRLSRSFGSADGVATGILASFAQDREGRIWIGSNANGLSVYEDGRFRRLSDRESPPSRSIAGLFVDSRGDLWIGTASHGLFRRREGRYEPFGVAQGLSHALVALMIEDREGTLWVSTGHGISRLTRDRIDEVAAGRRASLDPVVLDRRDGLLNVEGSGGGFDPSGLRDRDGRLWFSTIDGIAVVDPATFRFNTIAPRVTIETISLAGRPVVPNENAAIDVPPGTATLDLSYTAPSFLAPQQLRFRIRLRGVDDDWQDVGGRRAAYYTRLPPGDYIFEVLATNADGVASAPATMRLSVAPFWWERRLVQGAGAGLLLLVTALGVRKVSLRRVRARLAELEHARSLDRERARIARDLHDDLGSRLAHIAILAETSGAIDHDGRIVRAAREASQTMDELVWSINARNDTVESFAYYLGQFAEEYVAAAGLRCRLEIPVDLANRSLGADVRRHLYLASKEAITNAVKHARASEVGVWLRMTDAALVLEISDDGCGLPPTRLDPTGNGLKNLRERMTAAGGTLAVESAPGAGTRIRCTVPAPPARRSHGHAVSKSALEVHSGPNHP
jgi:ligand-binding sensor domain-containing protein/signal transduction histidine kinase